MSTESKVQLFRDLTEQSAEKRGEDEQNEAEKIDFFSECKGLTEDRREEERREK